MEYNGKKVGVSHSHSHSESLEILNPSVFEIVGDSDISNLEITENQTKRSESEILEMKADILNEIREKRNTKADEECQKALSDLTAKAEFDRRVFCINQKATVSWQTRKPYEILSPCDVWERQFYPHGVFDSSIDTNSVRKTA